MEKNLNLAEGAPEKCSEPQTFEGAQKSFCERIVKYAR